MGSSLVAVIWTFSWVIMFILSNFCFTVGFAYVTWTTRTIPFIVWVLGDFRAIRLVTSKRLFDSFSLHNRVGKKHRSQIFVCVLVTWYDVIGSHSNKKNSEKVWKLYIIENIIKNAFKFIYWKFIVNKLSAF